MQIRHELPPPQQVDLSRQRFRVDDPGAGRRPHPHPSGTLVRSGLEVPGLTDLEVHKNKVSAVFLNLITTVDAGVAESIGYDGSILGEITRRMSPAGLDTVGLPNHLIPGANDALRFVVGDPRRGRSGRIIYTLDCYGGEVRPSILVDKGDYTVAVDLDDNPLGDGGKTHRAKLSMISESSPSRSLTTFSPSYGPSPYPLVIGVGNFLGPSSYMRYDGLDSQGNLALVDGQDVRLDPSGNVSGIYSSQDHTITSSGSFPPVQTDDGMLVIGEGDQLLRFPLQTNLYGELAQFLGKDLVFGLRAKQLDE